MTPEQLKALAEQSAQIALAKLAEQAKSIADQAAQSAATATAEKMVAKQAADAQKAADDAQLKAIEDAKGKRGEFGTMAGGASAGKKFSAIRDNATFGQFVKSVMRSGLNPTKEAVVANAKHFGGEDMAKAVQEGVYDSAGVLVPVQQSGEMIEYLRPVSIFDKLKVRYVPFKSELQISKQTGTAALTWIGEGDTVSETKPTFGKIVLKAHKGMILVDISNDLLRNPAVGDAFVGEDVRAAMANGLDDAALNGTGQGPIPKGLLKQIHADNSFVRAGTSVANSIDDLDKAIEKVLTADLPMSDDFAWILHPAKEKFFKGLRDTAGWVFREEMREGRLNGRPYIVSTRVPSTKVIGGLWGQFLYGVDQDVLFSMHDVRAKNDETTLRAILRADFKIRQDKAFVEIKDS